MTKRLDEAFAELSKLPEIEQDAFAEWLLGELASEHRWEALFSKSHDRLTAMADEALDEYRKSQARRLRPDQA